MNMLFDDDDAREVLQAAADEIWRKMINGHFWLDMLNPHLKHRYIA